MMPNRHRPRHYNGHPINAPGTHILMNYVLLSITLLCATLARAETPMSPWLVAEVAKEMGTSPAEVRHSVSGKRCEGQGSAMAQCLAVQLAAREVRMRAQYARAQKRLPAARERDKLAKAQQAWILFRGASCDYEAGAFDDGRLRDMEQSACQVSMTEARIKTLRAYAECGAEHC